MKLTKIHQMMKICSIYVLIVWMSGCGLFHPNYTDYESESSGDGAVDETDLRKNCVEGRTDFLNLLSAAVASSCATSSCHQTTKIGEAVLVADNDDRDDINRLALLTYNGKDTTKLFKKIGEGPHSGGDFSSTIPQESLTTWIESENECLTNNEETTDEEETTSTEE